MPPLWKFYTTAVNKERTDKRIFRCEEYNEDEAKAHLQAVQKIKALKLGFTKFSFKPMR
jgi:hypothetical protein